MSDYKSEIDAFEKDKRYSAAAHTIKSKLEPLKSRVEIAKNRWFWELLQNAHDYNDSVNVEVTLCEDYLEFSHNGKPFTYTQARNLIEPDSDKNGERLTELNEPIGEFGTGFLATHILSTLITVSGVIETSENQNHFDFSFRLDRKTTDKSFLMRSIEDSLLQLNKDNPNPTNGQTKTVFRYDFSQSYDMINGYEIAEFGLNELDELLPFVMPFVPSIEDITINYSDGRKDFYNGYYTPISNVSYKLYNTEKRTNGVLQNTRLTAIFEHFNTSVLVNIEKTNEIISICDSHGKLPKQFKVFPLVGTESFNFPVVVQGKQFKPRTERDGLDFSKNDTDNRNSILYAVEAYKKLLIIAEKEEWRNQYLICKIKDSDFVDIPTKDWYQTYVVKKIRDSFILRNVVEIQTEDVVSSNGEIQNNYKAITLNMSCIPYHLDKPKNVLMKIYDFGGQIKPNYFPKKEHFLEWSNQLDFSHYEKQKFDLKRLIKEVSEMKNLSKLRESYKGSIELDNWLNDLIQYIIEMDKTLLETFPIIPNQNEVFTPPSKLYFDTGISESLKKILSTLATAKDFKNTLIHDGFIEHIGSYGNINSKTEKDICNEINDELYTYNTKRQEPIFLAGVNSVLDWMKSNKDRIPDEDMKVYFPWVHANKAQIYLETFSNPAIRDNIFIIAQSDKTDALAKLANSEISSSDIEVINDRYDEFKIFLNWIDEVVDDEVYANTVTGEVGENHVYSILVDQFGSDAVEWVSKNGEGRFDFKVLNNDGTIKYFIDAKTTSRGIANSNSVPFFMRKVQWEFLDDDECFDKYYIARVYKNGERLETKFLRINKQEILCNSGIG